MRVFLCKIFALTILIFRVTFTPVTLNFAWSKTLSQSQFRAAELNWQQFNTESDMINAPKLVSVFHIKS